MFDFAIGIGLIISIIATKRIWGTWFKQSADNVQLWAEETKNEQQHEIKRVYDERKNIKESQEDKWYSIDDIEALTK